MDFTEEQLLQRLQSGDEQAYADLVARYAAGLRRLAHALTGNTSDADDLVQQAMIAVIEGIHGFRRDASLKTWLNRIVVFQASKLRRSKQVRKADSIEFNEPASTHRSPQQLLEQKTDVMTMLQTLPADYREVLTLRELQGLSYQEIAETLKIPQGTVESRLFRARAALKEKFKGYLS